MCCTLYGNESRSISSASETPVALGQTLKFAVNANGVHLFDRETEKAL